MLRSFAFVCGWVPMTGSYTPPDTCPLPGSPGLKSTVVPLSWLNWLSDIRDEGYVNGCYHNNHASWSPFRKATFGLLASARWRLLPSEALFYFVSFLILIGSLISWPIRRLFRPLRL